MHISYFLVGCYRIFQLILEMRPERPRNRRKGNALPSHQEILASGFIIFGGTETRPGSEACPFPANNRHPTGTPVSISFLSTTGQLERSPWTQESPRRRKLPFPDFGAKTRAVFKNLFPAYFLDRSRHESVTQQLTSTCIPSTPEVYAESYAFRPQLKP